MDTQRKIALITGGSRGLGRNSALGLSKKDIDVIITYNNSQEEADTVVRQLELSGVNAAALQLDVGDVTSFENFTACLTTLLNEKWHCSNINYLVNNAGVGLKVPLAETTIEQFDMLMNIHFKGVFFLTQALLPHIADQGGIINLSTGLTRFSVEGQGTYAAMKGAIEVLTRYMAKEWGSRGIRVNSLAPGAIATDFGGGYNRDNHMIREHIGSITALGRIGEADDIGSIVASLCSEEMGWINGTRIEASGGMNL